MNFVLNMPSNQRVDVVVIGGGPAGTACAIALAKTGYSVAVLERSRYEKIRVGETLAPAARVLLSQLGVWDHFQSDGHIPSPGIISAWGSPERYENDFIFNPYGCGWHLDRRRFDAMLALAAQKTGVSIHLSTRVVTCTRQPFGCWWIEAMHESLPIRFQANFLVEATGRTHSLTGKPATKKIVYDKLMGVIKLLKVNSPTLESDYYTLVEASEEGWWYSAVLPDNNLVVAYMTDADLLPKGHVLLADFWKKCLQKAPHTLSRVQLCSWSSSLVCVGASSYRRNCVADAQWLAIGDAASAFDPLSSQGIYKALQSGIAAAKVINESQNGCQDSLDKYTQEVEKNFTNYLHTRVEYYKQERRWTDSVFWQRRQVLTVR